MEKSRTAPPAAAMITLNPFWAAVVAKLCMRSGVRCAEVIVTWKGMFKVFRSDRPGFRTGRSESEPIVTAMRGREVLVGKVGIVADLEAEVDVDG